MAIVGVARREQPLDLGMVEPVAAGRAIDDADDLGIDLAQQDLWRGRRLGVAGRPVVVARQALGIGHAPHLRCHLGRQPDLGLAHIGRIDGEAID
jgi:hypothetical protein